VVPKAVSHLLVVHQGRLAGHRQAPASHAMRARPLRR